MIMVKKSLLLASMALCFSVQTVLAQEETTVTTQTRKSLNVTVYNDGLGLVKDERAVNFTTGLNSLAFRDVSAQIQPETALFSGSGLKVLEQNFNFDLLSRHSLLQKFLGKNVQVIETNPGDGTVTTETAEVLSVDAGLVLKIDNRIEADYKGRLVFPDIPKNLRDKPTLVIDVMSAKPGQRDVQLSYLTNGLTWKTDYVAELNNEENAINLNGWVTLTNTSGIDYQNANIQFVAGKVNRVRPRPRPMMKDMAVMERAFAAAPMNAMEQENLMDYHLYSLGRLTTIQSNQTKQLALLSASQIKAEKEYRFDNLVPTYYRENKGDIETQSAKVYLKFENDTASGIGIPLPAGTIRVYKTDSQSRVLFVGEDSIRHTPKNEKIRLTLGEAFDVTVSGKQTEYTRFSEKSYEAKYELTFKNAKDVPVTVGYYQTFPVQWTIREESIQHSKENASQALWNVTIPAGGKTVLTYTLRIIR